MATLLSDKLTAPAKPARQFPHGVLSVTGVFTLTAALALNDVIQMVTVPAGAVIQEIIVSCDDLDTNATPAAVLDVGDGGDPDRFIAATTIGQTGGLARLGTHIGHGHKYDAEDTIDVLVKTAPATGATTGSIKLTVFYTMDK